MSTTTATYLEAVQRGLNKANRAGCFDLREAFLSQTALNTLNEISSRLDKAAPGVDPTLKFEPAVNSLNLVNAGLRKGNVNGAFELDESHALKVSVDGLVAWLNAASSKTTETVDGVTNPQVANAPAPTVTAAPVASKVSASQPALPRVLEMEVDDDEQVTA